MTRESIREYLATRRKRYAVLSREERRCLLDEIVAVTGYHRKAVIRALREVPRRPASGRRAGRPRRYGAEVAAAAEVLWEAAGQIGAKRLHPFVAELLQRLTTCGEVTVSEATATLRRAASVATLERLLAGARWRRPRRAATTTRRGTWLKQQIPMRTFAEWDDAQPGFLQVDLVAQRLVAKQRDGARLRRWHDRAQTPYQRLWAANAVSPTARGELDQLYRTLNPMQLRRDIDAALAILWRLAAREMAPGCQRPGVSPGNPVL